MESLYIMMVDKSCKECGNRLEKVSHTRGNGDEIVFLKCDEEGLYCVYDSTREEAVTTDAHGPDHEIDSICSIKMNNGDRLEVEYCSKCGFYAIDEGLPI